MPLDRIGYLRGSLASMSAACKACNFAGRYATLSVASQNAVSGQPMHPVGVTAGASWSTVAGSRSADDRHFFFACFCFLMVRCQLEAVKFRSESAAGARECDEVYCRRRLKEKREFIFPIIPVRAFETVGRDVRCAM